MIFDIHELAVRDDSGLIRIKDNMSEAREICEELDKTLLELMDSLKELSSIRNKYSEVVKEVSTI